MAVAQGAATRTLIYPAKFATSFLEAPGRFDMRKTHRFLASVLLAAFITVGLPTSRLHATTSRENPHKLSPDLLRETHGSRNHERVKVIVQFKQTSNIDEVLANLPAKVTRRLDSLRMRA